VEGIPPTSSRTQSTASGSRPFSEGSKAYEIEVFDPGPAKALDLVESGDIQPVR
jgi:hypothetical protein